VLAAGGPVGCTAMQLVMEQKAHHCLGLCSQWMVQSRSWGCGLLLCYYKTQRLYLCKEHHVTHLTTLCCSPPGCSDEMSEGLRGALNALLFRTGDQSRDFMVVVATNRPGQ
jgi:hypothetical protein